MQILFHMFKALTISRLLRRGAKILKINFLCASPSAEKKIVKPKYRDGKVLQRKKKILQRFEKGKKGVSPNSLQTKFRAYTKSSPPLPPLKRPMVRP